MDTTSTGPEAHATLTPEEEIHCHKARIFSVLTKAPVVRAWKSAICDGAVYLGKGSFPISYADRYFQTSSEDIAHVTFSIVTAFKETGIDVEGQEIERSQCHISPAQREASEFLIVTFSDDYDRIALLPHKLYWPVEGDESTDRDEALPDEISAATLSAYSFPINFLLANINEVKRITVHPMHPTTTPFQIGLDGKIPRAGKPVAIMPQKLGPHMTASDLSIHTSAKQEEIALRNMHDKFSRWGQSMKIDFLDYQPLLRDFKIVIPSGEKFPNGLEAVISHSVGHLSQANYDDDDHHLRYADYLLSYSITVRPNCAFVPRRLIPETWFVAPRPHESMPTELYKSGCRISHKEFVFDMDNAGRWVREVLKIVSKYPPGEHPTPAEKKQEIWKKALPWPEMEAQIALQQRSTPEKSQGENGQVASRNDSGTGGAGEKDASKSSDVSLLVAHYLEKVSLSHDEPGDDAT